MLEVKIICVGKLKERYWREAVEYHMLFFRRFFDSQEREDVLAGAGRAGLPMLE